MSQMERAAGFGHADNAPVKLDELGALLAQSSTPPQDAALFAEMLVSAQRWTLPLARSTAAGAEAKNALCPRFTSRGLFVPKSGFDDLRGCALG